MKFCAAKFCAANKITIGLVVLFSIFPLTDTDIWWHLACAREWVTTWTPVRTPVVNVHEFFQMVVGAVYGLGGAPLLVAFKAILWGLVFFLFAGRPLRTCFEGVMMGKVTEPVEVTTMQSLFKIGIGVFLVFIFRYHFEIRPVLFTLIFLGIYWNVLPWLFRLRHCEERKQACHERSVVDAIHNKVPEHQSSRLSSRLPSLAGDDGDAEGASLNKVPEPAEGASVRKKILAAVAILVIQWFWCKCQGLYILGQLFALLLLMINLFELRKRKEKICSKIVAAQVAFVLLLLAMPFLHREGLSLFLYPFGLLDRLLGLTPSAAIFASEIAENRSPITLLMAGENMLQCALMILLCVVGLCYGAYSTYASLRGPIRSDAIHKPMVLMSTALLALTAERNFVLFLPVFLRVLFLNFELRNQKSEIRNIPSSKLYQLLSLVFIFFIFGLWARSLSAYDSSMVAYQRVPVDAAAWMAKHPHAGRLFNDDRAGGYLAFVNPDDSTYIDGRFILKSAAFFGRYLEYANNSAQFVHDADSLNIDRAIFPIRYYARWDNLLQTLDRDSRWHLVYRDEYFVVLDKN